MIKNYSEAVNLLFDHINKNHRWGEFGNERLKYFLGLLGNPQNNFQTIHIAGTSGKGGTAYTTSKLLESHGYKVGLHISPHLLDIRERFQINNNLVNEEIVIKNLNKMLSAIEKCSNSFFGPPTYYELTLSLCYQIFSEEKIEIAVVEAGCGGLLDGTNSCNPQNKICVITKQGMDHENILGSTIEEITFNDAGIIKENNAIISLHHQLDTCRQIVEFYSKKNNGKLTYLTKNKDYNILKTNTELSSFTYFTDNEEEINLETNLLGDFQIENICMALKTTETFLGQKNKSLNTEKTRQTLKNLKRKGRFEKIIINGKTIILDGAHNPQKMKNFIDGLKKIYPNQKYNFLVAIKDNKNYNEILDPILPVAQKILTTNFELKQDFFLKAIEKPEYQKYFTEKKYQNRSYQKNPIESLKNILKQTKKNEILIITGSLYLLSFIYPEIEKIKK